ncbi:uncharacterized protein [Physcomitrium patens]|uniref:Peptidoglycan remodeling protein n=2 Tax=Physcomitrium patens TaxID=3218 RepID=W0RZK3_PHYPA|nr:uncharacterized protein LOC112275263 isoform X1 [Physcomitrium patens]PNR30975.1 hypothetical protein PHYPA_027291 [Physcomitrium patens]BAO23825.1 peptidoglycan remodeling protein [Physcomitrium patens]|eukprot:XP_024361263.1 uncharacterized protein LOC112275263 isoform X1 [Physcomitrella patens]
MVFKWPTLRLTRVDSDQFQDPDSLLLDSGIPIHRDSSCNTSPSSWWPSAATAKKSFLHREQSTRSAFASISMRPEMFNLGKTFDLLSQLFLNTKWEHRVDDGDSLAWLAEKYGTTVNALKKFNNMKDDIIYSGSILKIDRRSAEQAVLGRKASVQERNALLDDVAEITQPLKSFKPVLSARPRSQRLQKTHIIPRLKTVRVKYGDTLADIAFEHGLSSEELQRLNNLRDDNIFEGDVLAVSAAGPSSREFPENRSGRRRTNRLLFSRPCAGFSQRLGIGGPEQTLKHQLTSGNLKLQGRWKRNHKGFQHAQDKWMRFSSPVTEGFLSSTYGWRWGAFHEGIDVAADQGTPILASDRGTVTFAGWSGGYGYLVAIQHEGGFVTRYAHCCAIHSRIGQQVLKGQQVAAVGATGRATGPHLHFEVRKNGEALDPLKWVRL